MLVFAAAVIIIIIIIIIVIINNKSFLDNIALFARSGLTSRDSGIMIGPHKQL